MLSAPPSPGVLVHEKVVSFLSEDSAYQSLGAVPLPAERSPFLARLVSARAGSGTQSQSAQMRINAGAEQGPAPAPKSGFIRLRCRRRKNLNCTISVFSGLSAYDLLRAHTREGFTRAERSRGTLLTISASLLDRMASSN